MDDVRFNRLRFRAWRRGFREADLILGGFVDAHARELSPSELDDLERLMDELDHDIFDWVMGKTPIPTAFETPVMTKLRAFQPAP